MIRKEDQLQDKKQLFLRGKIKIRKIQELTRVPVKIGFQEEATEHHQPVPNNK